MRLRNTSPGCAARRSARYHLVAGDYLLLYAQESSWRDDHRRLSNGDQTFRVVGLALAKATSPDFVGYWQRHIG